MNPFTVGVAQGIAGLPLFSGMAFRIVLYITMVTIAAAFVMRYVHKIKKNPQLSPMYEYDKTREDNMDLENLPDFGTREKVILGVFFISIVILVFGVVKWAWYMDEIAALFFAMSFICGLIGKLGFNRYAVELGAGMANVASGALVGVSRQTTCIAFQIGDGISNIFTPTSGYFMAGLALARIPWDKWAKWILPMIGIQYLVGAIFVFVAEAMQLGPF